MSQTRNLDFELPLRAYYSLTKENSLPYTLAHTFVTVVRSGGRDLHVDDVAKSTECYIAETQAVALELMDNAVQRYTLEIRSV